VLYVLVAGVLTAVVPYKDFKSNDPLAYAMRVMGFDNVATLFAFGAMVAMTAVLLVFQYGQTRIFMVMSRDGLLPPVFSRIHPRFPHAAHQHLDHRARGRARLLDPDARPGDRPDQHRHPVRLHPGVDRVIVLRFRAPDLPRPFKVPLYPVTPILSALACLGLIPRSRSVETGGGC